MSYYAWEVAGPPVIAAFLLIATGCLAWLAARADPDAQIWPMAVGLPAVAVGLALPVGIIVAERGVAAQVTDFVGACQASGGMHDLEDSTILVSVAAMVSSAVLIVIVFARFRGHWRQLEPGRPSQRDETKPGDLTYPG